MMIVDGKKHRYGGTIPWTVSPWAVTNLGIGLAVSEQTSKRFRSEPRGRQRKPTMGPISMGDGSRRTPCPSRPPRCWTWPLPPDTSAASETSLLWVLLPDGVCRRPHFAISGKAVPKMLAGRRDGCHLPADRRRTRRGATSFPTGPADHPGRRRRHGPRGRLDPAGPASHRGDSALAIASSIATSRCCPVDRAFLHQRMPSGAVFKISISTLSRSGVPTAFRPVRRAGYAGHADHRRLHQHRRPRAHVRDHRGTRGAPAGQARRGRAQELRSFAEPRRPIRR